jgi:N-acetylmuramoyl-L-alanine amidase
MKPWARGTLVAAIASVALVAEACSPGESPSRSSPPASGPPGPTTTEPSPDPSGQTELPIPMPSVVQDLIPFPESRKEETRAYAREHYGLDTFELVDPQVIVEHFTANDLFLPVFNTFAADSPHLGELPGTCAHFVIEKDGTIHQLVPTDIMCRHTVGLNWTAIGIEMVGRSDQEILGNTAELNAALRLTMWLMQRFHIQLRNVIGHNESLTSPLHMELVSSLKCQTHQDWNHQDMQLFRAELSRLTQAFRLPLGPPAEPVANDC